MFLSKGELLRAVVLIQQSPSPSSRTSSLLLGSLSPRTRRSGFPKRYTRRG
ncbi:hypothetical protein DPMN_130955 [Dreissena polymorpha]|uniref:Uncharacterized protein n=1 Tax=Dreissena polymorpha TaxID=45954 RepID=A0A9D4K1N2_DREPO|nr:hypothetical protein DPMN_130955 [Dreissena polymorpha]